MSIGFDAVDKKRKHEVYMCELENDERKGPGRGDDKKRNQGNMTSS